MGLCAHSKRSSISKYAKQGGRKVRALVIGRGRPKPPSAVRLAAGTLRPLRQPRVEVRGGFLLEAGQNVALGVEGHRDAGMAQVLADHFGVDAPGQEEAGVGVPQIVKPHGRQAGPLYEASEPLGKPVRRNRRAQRVCKE